MYNPLLYSKTVVCRGIPIFLTFAPKHTLWIVVRTCTHNVCFKLNYTHRNKLGNTCNNVTTNFGLYNYILLCKNYEECLDNLSESVVSKSCFYVKMVSIKHKLRRRAAICLLFRKCLLNLRNAQLVFAITLLFELTLSEHKAETLLVELDHKFFIC